MNLGAPELLIILLVLGLPVGVAIAVILAVRTKATRPGRAGAPNFPPPPPSVRPDWYPDPSGRFDVRYHDGSRWTEHVARAGIAATDPLS